MLRNIKEMLFGIKWMFMSREARYVYLWNRTKNQNHEFYQNMFRKY